MPYQRQTPIDLLDRDDLDSLLAACGTSLTGTRDRNRALLAAMYFAGLRVAEALALRPCDVRLGDDGTATLNERSGKGGKQRVVTLAAPGVVELDRWLDRRADVTTSRTAALFCTHAVGRDGAPGSPLTTGYVRNALVRIARRAGLGKRIHAHAFRHAHASYLHHRGVPIAAIQAQLGHSSPLTTLRYLASIGAHDAHRHVAAAFASLDQGVHS